MTKRAALLLSPVPQAPHAQPELGGEPGLTSEEIAIALGARHDNVTAKIQKLEDLTGINFPKVAGKFPGRGRPRVVYVLGLTEAKMVVARYENHIGVKYLRYLIEFESRARDVEPEMRVTLAEMQKTIEELRAQLAAVARPRALPKAPTIPVTMHVAKYESIHNDGDVYHRTRAPLPINSLTHLELLKAKRAHMILSIEGISRRLEKTDLEIEFLEQPASQRLRPLK